MQPVSTFADRHRLDGRQDRQEEGRGYWRVLLSSRLCFHGWQCQLRYGKYVRSMYGVNAKHDSQFICARIVAGLGIGFVNTIIPSWVSELSSPHNRGSNFSLVFVANYLGIVIAYWLNFGIRDSDIEFRWRFPLAFMSVPMLIVLLSIFLLPESPRSVPSPVASSQHF